MDVLIMLTIAPWLEYVFQTLKRQSTPINLLKINESERLSTKENLKYTWPIDVTIWVTVQHQNHLPMNYRNLYLHMLLKVNSTCFTHTFE
jgi:hypothetical protein